MNVDRMDRHYLRLLVLAIVIHVYHDWGIVGQFTVPFAALAYAFFVEWRESKAALPATKSPSK